MVRQGRAAPKSPGSGSVPFYLIDASIFFFRYYFSMPDNWWAEAGYGTGAVYGYSQWLRRFLADVEPEYAVACFDESLETCFRNQIYPDYKVSRALPDDALVFQLQAAREVTEAYGVPSYASSTHEADDLIGTLAARGRKRGLCPVILTRDKDLGQLLLESGERLWDYPDGNPLCREGLFAKLGVWPEQMADFLALVGDPGDDIPGVPGVGPKTAAALLARGSSWQTLSGDLDAVAQLPIRGAAGLAERLAMHREQVDMALQLATIALNAPLGRRMQLRRRKPDIKALGWLGESLGMPNALRVTPPASLVAASNTTV